MSEARELKEFPDLTAGMRFLVAEGIYKGKAFTLDQLHKDYWLINIDGVEGNKWAAISLETKVIQLLPKLTEDLEGKLDYFERQINTIISILSLSLDNNPNVSIVKPMVDSLLEDRYNFLNKKKVINAAQSKTANDPGKNEVSQAGPG